MKNAAAGEQINSFLKLIRQLLFSRRVSKFSQINSAK